MDGRIRVLHVDDDPGFVDLTAEFLEGGEGRLSVVPETSARAGLDRLEDERIDCVVSDHDMPGMDGLEFLERVRERHPELPFILFTGKGSEEIASEAVSAGVTDYLRKRPGTEQYELLENRIRNAVEQYRTRERLAEREEEFQAFVEHSSDIVTVLDEDGTVTYESPSVEEVLGYEPGEGIGECAFEYVHPEDRGKVFERFGDLVDAPEGHTERVEFRARHADGGWVWVESVGTNRTGGSVEGYVVNTRDITERKERERELEEERERYSTLVSQSHDGVVIVQDGVYEFVNERVVELTGYPEEELLGMAFDEVMTEEYRELVRERHEKRVQGGGAPRQYDIDIRDAEGERLHVALTVSRIRYEGEPATMANFRDITDRKERERRMRALSEATREFVTAGAEREVAERVVEAAKELLEYPFSAVRLLSREDNTLKPVAVTEESEEMFGERPAYDIGEGTAGTAFERGEPLVVDRVDELDDGHDRGEARSGMYFPIGRHGVLTIADVEPGAFDRSDRRIGSILAANAEASLDRLDREREIRRQNEHLEEFAGVVSHDLRNPLEVASSRLELLRETSDPEHADAIAGALERMDGIIENTLALARHGRTIEGTEPVDLGELVDRCRRTVDTGGATVRVGDLPTVEADPDRLRHLFENLFRNSVEHGSTGPRSGAPEDSAEHGSTSPRNGGDALDPGDEGVTVRVGPLEGGFYVEDDGVGIPPGEREEVFEAGHSTAEDGTGFGLAIVERIAEAHGWEVAVAEGTDGGARFEFRGVDVPEVGEA